MMMNYGRWKSIRERCQGISDGQSRMTAAILNLQRDRGLRKGAMMERLTQKAPDSEMVWFKDKERLFEPCEMSAHQSRLAIAKLAAYEQAEEQGLILRLPCKVGDKIFLDFAGFGKDIDKFTVKDFHLDCFEDGETILYCDYESNDKTLSGQIDVMEFGKTVFLTREEAEAKLAEMEGAE